MPSVAIDNAAASGDTVVLPAVAGQKVRVRGYVIDAAGPVAVTWKGGANALTGAAPLVAGVPLVVPMGGSSADPSFWFETNPGEALILNASAAVQVSGHVAYDRTSA